MLDFMKLSVAPLVPNLGDEYMIYKELTNRTVLLGESVEISYIAGAGAGSTQLNISGQVDTPLLVGKAEGVTLIPVLYILTP